MSDAVRRRSFLTMGLAAPAIAGVSACSGGRGSSPGRRGSDGRTQVTFWSSLRGSHEVVQAFNESQDDIEVVFSQIPDGGSGGYANIRNAARAGNRSEEHTSELQSRGHLVCRLLLEKKTRLQHTNTAVG